MIDQIEDAIVAKIKNASGMAYLKTLASYGGELDDDLDKVVRSYPAVWIIYAGGGKPKKIANGKWKTPATFALMAAARNVRNEAATRKGSSGEVGSYQILKDASALILGQDLGLKIENLEPGAVRSLYNTKIRASGLSVLSQEWTTAYIQTKPTEAEVDLLRIGLNYYIKPGDDVVDASDDLTLTP